MVNLSSRVELLQLLTYRINLFWMMKWVMLNLKGGMRFFFCLPDQILLSPLLARYLKVQQAGSPYTDWEDGSHSWLSSKCWKKYLSSTRVLGSWLGWNV